MDLTRFFVLYGDVHAFKIVLFFCQVGELRVTESREAWCGCGLCLVRHLLATSMSIDHRSASTLLIHLVFTLRDKLAAFPSELNMS